MKSLLRRLVILGTPLVLSVLLLAHPAFTQQTGLLYSLLPEANWWLTIHLFLLPLFYLIALAAFLLIEGRSGIAATVSRLALGIFVICYPAFDVLIGIGIGTLVRYAASLPTSQQALVERIIEVFLHSPFVTLLVLLGSLGWEVGLLTAALTLSFPVRSRLLVAFLIPLAILFEAWGLLGGILVYPFLWWVGILTISLAFSLAAQPRLHVGLLVLAAFLFGTSHVPPFGPLGMACFFLAALLKAMSDEASTRITVTDASTG